jgi:hypothetical protein
VLYLAAMGIVFWLLLLARQRVIATLDNPAARAQWQAWKEQVEKEQGDPNNPVRRRAPAGDEPPGLVLMRDHFAAVASLGLLISTLIFGFIVLVLQGLSRPPSAAGQESP